jgi:low temperature requirement protein LtrA
VDVHLATEAQLLAILANGQFVVTIEDGAVIHLHNARAFFQITAGSLGLLSAFRLCADYTANTATQCAPSRHVSATDAAGSFFTYAADSSSARAFGHALASPGNRAG